MLAIPKLNCIAASIKAVVFTAILVSILGYIDYITGEISIDLLYVLCVCAVTWYTGILVGILCVLEILFTKMVVGCQYNINMLNYICEWYSLTFLFICIVVCVLIGRTKMLLYK